MRGPQRESATLFGDHLAAEQIQALNAVRAFVNHVKSVIAPVLFDCEVARVAVAAVYLNSQVVGFEAPFTGPALRDGRENFEQQCGVFRSLRVPSAPLVNEPRAIKPQRQSAFGIRFLGQEHPLDVGVFENGHLRCGDIFATRSRGTALRAIACVG